MGRVQVKIQGLRSLLGGLAEIMRLGVALGGAEATFAGLAGMGDLVATCTSPQSRNRNVGYELGKGRSIDEIINEMYMVAEGVKSAPAVIALAEKYKIQMPIAEEVYNVTRGNSSARKCVSWFIEGGDRRRVRTRLAALPVIIISSSRQFHIIGTPQ